MSFLDGETFKGYLANALILAGFPALFIFFLLPTIMAREAIPNVVWPASAIVLVSLLFLGSRAFIVTTFYYLIAAWLALSVLSHLYALGVLDRALEPYYLYANLGFVLAMALVYRAVFCMVLINPRFATRVFVATVIFALSGAAVLGLMQRYGPGADWAMKFATRFAPAKDKVLEGIQNGRPTSIFGGPNLLGFADTILACFALAWGLTDIKRITPPKVMLVMALLGLATMSAVASQSRSTVLLLLPFPVIFGIQLRRRAENQFNTVLLCALVVISSLGFLFVLQTGRFDYLYSVRHTGISHDLSYTVRVQAIGQLERISPEIAPLGSGIGESNIPHMDYTLGYDRYSTIGVDNEWANAFEAFGVWGPIWLLLFFGVWARYLYRLRGDRRYDPAFIFYLGATLLVSIVILSPASVRVLKYDTGGFLFFELGALAAWSVISRRVTAEGGPQVSLAGSEPGFAATGAKA